MSKFLDEIGVAHFWDNIKSYFQENYGNSGGGGSVDIPSGIICAWSGTESNVPSGWHICDGTNGTPDLRDRFILGAGAHTVGSTGGSETVTLTEAQMPEHRHAVSRPASADGNSTGAVGWLRQTATSSENFVNAYSSYAGSSEPHPNMPPYYTLCYIMKL